METLRNVMERLDHFFSFSFAQGKKTSGIQKVWNLNGARGGGTTGDTQNSRTDSTKFPQHTLAA